MGRRWITKEVNMIETIRRTLAIELANRPQFPEVVGDRRILRFLRGKQHNVDEAITMIRQFLQWRLDNNVDSVRQDILYGGRDSPYNFPNGKLIIDLAPQIVLSVNALDKRGQPLSLEQYNFSPKEVFKTVSMDDYLKFLTYCLEYRALVLEQLSHEREQAYLAAHPDESTRADGYGVIVMDFTIRDLKGVGLAHLGSEGRALVAAALKLGLPNYQEYMAKSHMVNVPWVFSSMWYFVKGMLDEFTLAKLTLSGSDYMDTLLKEVPFESIPARLGGGFTLYNERYEFDLSATGALYYEGAPHDNRVPKESVKVTVAAAATAVEEEIVVEHIDTDDATKLNVVSGDTAVNQVRNEAPSDSVSVSVDNGSQQSKSPAVAYYWDTAVQHIKSELVSVSRGAPYFSLLVLLIICHAIASHSEKAMCVLFLAGTVNLLLSTGFALL